MAAASRETLVRRLPISVPPMLMQPGIEKMDAPITLPDHDAFPRPSFTGRRRDDKSRDMPQCIAHRGYRERFPENTMAAFRGAVDVGAHALETDVHLTSDHVVVLSHDATLKRCFGRPDKIVDTSWKDISQLRTIAAPHEPMPRLRDLLEYLAQPGLEDLWVLLDIKLDNDADAVMRLLGTTLAAEWRERVVLGIWAANYLPLAAKYLPGFAVTHIGFSVTYARHFFDVPNVSFNMLFPILVGPGGPRFLRDAQCKYHREVYAWTVNAEDRMRWCIRRQLDGVITDDPRLFLDVCDRYDPRAHEPRLGLTWSSYWDVCRIWMWISVAAWVFWSRLTPVASRNLIRKAAADSAAK